ncbi:MAG TPA: ABC transporter ATP-binding protein [Bryobacteraceae bacterium]|nr:ABC transporter ATP-binding protein [Bryobacteraceae bacterium]
MISCKDITKNFGEFHAVSHASFLVPRGSICALLGPNGAGKSTVVKILTGLLRATSGSVEICGTRSDDPALKRIIGILPESLALFDALTVAEHLDLTGAAYKLEPAVIRERTDQLLRVLRLEHGRSTFIHQCSYGMRKKTALAMALLPNPRALFLDEPFEGIDPVTAETIRMQLRSIARRGITVLLTSHILSLVDRVADKVVMINRGRIVFDANTNELPDTLENLYFEMVERAEGEELAWLGPEASQAS